MEELTSTGEICNTSINEGAKSEGTMLMEQSVTSTEELTLMGETVMHGGTVINE